MTAATAYPHVEKTGHDPAHLQRLPRIRIAQIVVDYLNHGWSADEIVIHYPHLKPAEVHSAMAYYFDHEDEIDGEIADEQLLIAELLKNTPPTPAETRLRAEGLLPKR